MAHKDTRTEGETDGLPTPIEPTQDHVDAAVDAHMTEARLAQEAALAEAEAKDRDAAERNVHGVTVTRSGGD